MLAVGALALLLVLFRLVDIPAPDVPTVAEDSVDFSRKVGVFLALLASRRDRLRRLALQRRAPAA